MAVRIGSIVEGSPYTMKLHAAADNDGVTLVLVGWIPAQGADARSWALRVEPGQFAVHANTAPPHASYFGIEFEVDVPDTGGGGSLSVDGVVGGTKVVPVRCDETYRLLIVER